MLGKLRDAKLVWPTLATLIALAVLLQLGTWQLERKRWKEDLQAKIAARVAAEPVSISAITLTVRDQTDFEYLHVFATGRFHHDKERHLYAPAPSGLAWHIYTPLETHPGLIVWVNRGMVPDANKSPETRSAGQVTGTVKVRGIARFARSKALFAAENNPGRNLWYWPDQAAMTASAFPSGTVKAMGVFVEADAQPLPPGGLPKGGVTRLTLSNRHLEYAVTWYGLALTLVGVYLAFAITRLRAL